MKFPNKSSQTFFVLQSLYKSGSQGYNDLQTKFENLSRGALTTMAVLYCLHFDGKGYHLPTYLKKWFQDMEPVTPKALGEIAASRKVSSKGVLTDYAANMTRNLREPIRDIGFMSASPSASVFWTH